MPSSSRSPSKPSLLTREQGDEVLRYWLAALRLEEALQVRPQARRAIQPVLVPKLEQPTQARIISSCRSMQSSRACSARKRN
ncbi:MAG: hypothetical protein WDO74_02040 [Pseudomonadota bacterium]